MLSTVLCDWFLLHFFVFGSFSALSYSLYRCVYCFSVFVLIARMEIIIIIIISYCRVGNVFRDRVDRCPPAASVVESRVSTAKGVYSPLVSHSCQRDR